LRRKLEPKAESLEAKTGTEIGRFSCNVSHVFSALSAGFLGITTDFRYMGWYLGNIDRFSGNFGRFRLNLPLTPNWYLEQ
jgi:hypothetical protein